ncbi:hypothetical protein CN481_16905 [Bacillus sp. AFS006103]|nr:hypothetical protein CN481_16905 [Bacillus sp. AFS006103]
MVLGNLPYISCKWLNALYTIKRLHMCNFLWNEKEKEVRLGPNQKKEEIIVISLTNLLSFNSIP